MISNMSQPLGPTIREVLLTEIIAQDPTQGRSGSQNLQQSSVLDAVAMRLNIRGHHPDLEMAVLTQWDDLFRTGLLAWGLNLANPNPPFFHLTERGRKALASITRDPSNPAGYIRHLDSLGATIDPIAMSYLSEGLDCYVDGLFKASAVMVGCAAESVILSLRDTTVAKLTSLGKPAPSNLNDWKIKAVSDALRAFFDRYSGSFDRKLREPFEAYWAAFAQQIRAVRNDAGHPISVDPVTPDTVHASLLIFPELAKLASSLSEWVNNNLT
jgi:hypothetical protein